MKLPQEIIERLLGDANVVDETVKFVRTLNAIASIVMISLVIYLPYQAIREVLTWF